MNKKGFQFTLEMFLKILIAVICIGILLYLGIKIYDTFSSSENEKKAVTFIKEFESKINAFKSSDLTEMTYLGFPPVGSSVESSWYLKNFDVASEGHPPNQCVGKYTSCLCVFSAGSTKCSKKSDKEISWSNIQYCDDLSVSKAACKGFNEKVTVNFLVGNMVRGEVVIVNRFAASGFAARNSMPLASPMEIKVSKVNKDIALTGTYVENANAPVGGH